MSDTSESEGSRGTTASELLEKLLQKYNIKDVNKEVLNEEEQQKLEGLQKKMEQIIEDNKNDLASVKSELQKFIGYNDDENIEITDEEYNKFLAELGISQEEEEEKTVEEEEEAAPGKVEAVTATVNAEDIENGLKNMNYENINIKIENNEIEVTAKPPAALGGKSKKKQLKPKNKSNKKMKNKQTKKGGKQIKKRSLKRKMKK